MATRYIEAPMSELHCAAACELRLAHNVDFSRAIAILHKEKGRQLAPPALSGSPANKTDRRCRRTLDQESRLPGQL